ncbi:MAG TPA: aminotransferase class V-fold PLP-dependent enzyme [Candidatus Woesebacteria bacterium]|nr:aminotransferase class V-fold PLP-dependent enzyme [Candidatus Woesebacteria bacterium]
MDSENIAVRSGHHCCMPLHTHFGWPATVRASFGVYNSPEDIDKLIDGLKKVKKVFG